MAPKIIPLEGKRFGRLTVVRLDQKKGKDYYYICLCDCGNTVSRGGSKLRNLSTELTSCGCAFSERRVYIKHGQWQSLTYNSWSNMIQRCTNPNNPRYNAYGKRGIKICDQWLVFENFLKDMGERPSSDHSIDRIDVNGNYTIENCQWSTSVQQNKNKRSRKKYKTCLNCGKLFNRRGTTPKFCSSDCYHESTKKT
jgi:hypothetical protein